jgi:hypothetical protein
VVGVSMMVAFAVSLQGCVRGEFETSPPPTAQPTLAPTSQLTVQPTLAPTAAPTGFDINIVANALRILINTDVFLAKINTAIQTQMPNSVSPKVGAKVGPHRSCKVNTPFGCGCWLEYDVTAGLSQCTGLRTAELVKLKELDTTDFVTGELGDLRANVGAVLRVGGAMCSGSAQAMVQPCIQGAKIPASGSVTAAVAIDDIVGHIRAKIVNGTDSNKDKLCLKVTEMTGQVDKNNVKWHGVAIKIGAAVVGIPPNVLDAVWGAIPVDSVVEMIKNKVLEAVQTKLDEITPCF